jgi:thiamine pyrophosphokinase
MPAEGLNPQTTILPAGWLFFIRIDGSMTMRAPKRALIFVNGSLPDPQAARGLVQPEDVLLAADGGARRLMALGLIPAVVIGDLDSLDEAERQKLEAAGTAFQVHPRAKDETDLELALAYALGQGYAPILIVAALGGRLDQTLANLSLLSAPACDGREVRLEDGQVEAFFTRGRAVIHGTPGDLVSLIPWGAPVEGVTTRGLRWALRGERLLAHATRGISNEMRAVRARVEVSGGRLLIVHTRQGS